ncbi:hypothetical protein OF83DRAFT_1060962 [Amylostereum chailletii]|nr:hypothetical protein OF83DRAFT_1060962 [Amylostereum chailletii]
MLAAAPSLDLTIGAIEVGVLLSFILFGATVVQLYTYYQSNFVHDGRALKTDSFSSVLECVHTALIGAYIYISTITNFGDHAKLRIAHWTLGFSIPVASLVMVLVQGFFAYRIYVLSRKWTITVLSWFGQSIRVASALGIAIVSHIVQSLPLFIERYRWLVILSFATGALIDILNTAALGYFLYRAKKQVGKSRKMLEVLIVWTIGAAHLHVFFVRIRYSDLVVETGMLTTYVILDAFFIVQWPT